MAASLEGHNKLTAGSALAAGRVEDDQYPFGGPASTDVLVGLEGCNSQSSHIFSWADIYAVNR